MEEPTHPIWSHRGLSDEKLRDTLANPDDELFVKYAALLLEATMEPEKVKDFMEPEILARHYHRIRPSMSRGSRTYMNRQWWDRVVESLQERFDVEAPSPSSLSKPTGTETAKAVGERIRDIREKEELTLKDVADRLKISPQAVSNMERGQTRITFDRIQQVLNVMGYKANLVIKEMNGNQGEVHRTEKSA